MCVGCTTGRGGGAAGGDINANVNVNANANDNGTPDSGSDCGGEVTAGGGGNELPHYDLLPAPPVPRAIRERERPAQVDLSAYVPTPCNQQTLNSCVAWAGAYGLMTYLAAENIDGWVDLDRADRHFSPTFVFNQVNAARLGRSRYDSCTQAGTFASDMFTLLRDTGCVTWDVVPYTVDDCETPPPADAVSAASDSRIAYFRAVERDVATIQGYLDQRIPVLAVLRIGVAAGTLSPGEVYDAAEAGDTYAHAVLAVGYDDNIGAIKIMNSWGTQWGDGGFGFVAYDAWEAISSEAYVVGRELVTPTAKGDGPTDGKRRIRAQSVGARGCADSPLTDTDGDGYPDTLELEFAALGYDPLVPDPNPDFVPPADADDDGWPNETEVAFGTDPQSADDFPFNCEYQYPEDFFFEFIISGKEGQGNFVEPAAYAVGNNPRAVTAADLDTDGDLDLIAANSGPIQNPGNTLSILVNYGDATFASQTLLTTGSGPNTVLAVDLDLDGDADLITANDPYVTDATVSVLRNDGNSAFTWLNDIPLYRPGSADLATGELNGDGFPDLAVTTASSPAYVSILPSRGDGSAQFDALVELPLDIGGQTFPRAVVVADLTNDGNPDIAVSAAAAVTGPGTVSVLINDGRGGFAPAVHYAAGINTAGMTADDMDNDGLIDLIVTNQGTAESRTISVKAIAGVLPLVPANQRAAQGSYADSSISVLQNQGGGTFALVADLPAGASPSSVVVADVDADGNLDILAGNSAGNTVSVFLNQGGHVFQETDPLPAGAGCHDLVLGDLDGDRDLDLATANFASVDAVTIVPGEVRVYLSDLVP